MLPSLRQYSNHIIYPQVYLHSSQMCSHARIFIAPKIYIEINWKLCCALSLREQTFLFHRGIILIWFICSSKSCMELHNNLLQWWWIKEFAISAKQKQLSFIYNIVRILLWILYESSEYYLNCWVDGYIRIFLVNTRVNTGAVVLEND